MLYNCAPEDSETIRSLINTEQETIKARLCIWNNGPKTAKPTPETIKWLHYSGIEAIYIETLENQPLSWIYNHFIKKFNAKKYVILDHDSKVSKEYKAHVFSDEIDFIGAPRIEAKGSPRSPSVKGKFSPGPYKKNECVTAIGSGVVVSSEAAQLISKIYGDVFDEKFALYGVDTSLFLRVHRLGLSDRVKLIPGFEHSLSRLENEPSSVKEFRKTERSYDFGLTVRNYPEILHIKFVIKQALLCLLGKGSFNLVAAMKAFASGRHEKCIKLSKKEFIEALENQAQNG